jgi:hypothetical protein
MRAKDRSALFAVGVAVSLAAAASGCEIIASFDRSLIPVDAGAEPDAPYERLDGAATDAGADSATDATGTTDTGPGVDAHVDASEAGQDAGEAGQDANVNDTGTNDGNSTDVTDGSAADTSAPDSSDTGTPDSGDDAAG